MKRAFTVFCAVLFVLIIIPSASASGQSSGPDWLVTEICADTKGFTASQSGYTNSADCGEFIELYNNSDRELNLYDYCIIYNGDDSSSANYHKQITEITPIKAGDYRDSTTGKQLMTNPATCSVKPGECVVLWVIFSDAITANITVAQFRTHWGISSDVKVIAFDGNGTTTAGGHTKNFNVKNSGVGTYGIALYNSTLQSKKDSYIDTPSGYDAYSAIISYATVDYSKTGTSLANYTVNFLAPTSGKECVYNSYLEYGSTTPGYLNEAQIISLNSESQWVKDMYGTEASTVGGTDAQSNAETSQNTTAATTDGTTLSSGKTPEITGCSGITVLAQLTALVCGAAVMIFTVKKK